MPNSTTEIPLIIFCSLADQKEVAHKLALEISSRLNASYLFLPCSDSLSSSVHQLPSFPHLTVSKIKDKQTPVARVFYDAPFNQVIHFKNGQFQITSADSKKSYQSIANSSLHHLAEAYQAPVIVIASSGEQMPRLTGFRQIKKNKGLILIPQSATAFRTQLIDQLLKYQLAHLVIPTNKLADVISEHLRQLNTTASATRITHQEFEQLAEPIFNILQKHTKHDFSKYKANTIIRRLERRLSTLKINSLEAYLNLLRTDKQEALTLNNELLIGVTGFFRDPPFFEKLYDLFFPRIFSTPQNNTVRIWVPACATGEEAYSIAILAEEYRSKHALTCTIKIFASDIDHWAINKAREGIYPHSISTQIKRERLANYFTKTDQAYKVKSFLRERIIFAKQNVLTHPPYSSIDLISCRNLLIYFGAELQEQVLALFHYALNPQGILFLGNSENLGNSSRLYSVISRKAKIFRKKHTIQPTRRYWNFNQDSFLEKEKTMQNKKNTPTKFGKITRKLASAYFLPPSVLINSHHDILYFQGKTNNYLEQPSGEPTINLLQSVKKGLSLPLAHAIRKAQKSQHQVIKKNIKVGHAESHEFVDIIITPVSDQQLSEELWLVTFASSSSQETKQAPVARNQKQGQLEELKKELQETQEYLQTTIDELERTNNELKVANEEEQSINEELQSANEELETSKEELQAINEELNQSNIQLQEKIDELTNAKNDILNLLRSTQIATIFLDRKLCITRFTPSISTIVELIESDLGRPLEQFNNKLDYPHLINDLQHVLKNQKSIETEVKSKDKLTFWMRISPYQTINKSTEGLVITFTDITEKKKQEQELITYKDHLEELVETRTAELHHSFQNVLYEQQKAQQYLDIASVMIITMDQNGIVTLANKRASEILGNKQEEIVGKEWIKTFIPDSEVKELNKAFVDLLTGGLQKEEYRENHVKTKNGTQKLIAWHNAFIKDDQGNIIGLISSGQDITEQQKTRIALEESERNLKLAQQVGNIGVWFFDITQQIYHGSEIFQNMYGFSTPEVTNQQVIDAFAEGELERLAKVYEGLMNGNPSFHVEHKIIHQKTGEERWLLSSGDLLFDDNKKPYRLIGTTQDISDRMRSRIALHESKEKFKGIFDYSITGIAVANHEGQLLEINSEFIRMLGYSKDELLAMNFAEFSNQEDLKQERKLLNQMHQGKLDHYRMEKRFITATGQTIWVDVAITAKRNKQGKVDLFIGTASDITAKKQAEQDLKNNNQFIQTILDHLPIGVSTNKIDEGEATYMNKRFQEIYGWGEEELKNIENFFERVYPDKEYREQIKSQILRDIHSGDSSRMHWENIEITQKDGSKRIVDAVNIPLPEQNTMISTVLDVSELRKTEKALLKAKNEAEHANALKSAFLANTSHEIRTPLNGIIGFSELLQEHAPNNKRVHTYVNIIKNSGAQLLKIIDDIIDVSKIDSNQLDLQYEVFELNRLIDETLYFHQHSKLYRDHPQVEIKVSKPAKELLIHSDRMRIKQILDNLITNAIKQTNHGYIEFGYQLKGTDQLSIYVKDTGIGIEKEQLEKIFERFVKLQSKSGTGLGLSIVKGLVNLLKGEIAIDSSIGEGTVFQITFPVDIQNKPKKIPQSDTSIQKDSNNLSGKLILVAEDDFNSYLLIDAILKKTKARLVHISTGDQILDAYKQYQPDLILMDINMPRVNGIQATKLIRKDDQHTPIIAQTAYALENEKQMCLDAGCTDYIAKPIDRLKLMDKIHRALIQS
ncbi:PAS domain S-box protein [Sunxiuqinia elliptica]|uniref:PAS domain S-box-containing protein n=1 Tax=Sunxiuqinia elliptica TaxID=655355 RepID=A0A4R6H9X5_9BACT|nr:PAS domain S-box protein [Sunxiuqinia elliptica]TDO04924.1 PAS domain S-box-containing protein [Sunxiuqinia elliptica]TDO64472.1 PAS domain S-box-containing protein [Sunxiuqinia elliptica]